MSYEIKLPLFKGPFDLLLFFIERDELDIMDIPISQITNDFLDYVSDLEKMNIEVASEFIVVAATLMRIKSRMLLPRLTVDDDGNEIDPRDELVEHLMEYKKYKSVIDDFSKLEDDRQSKTSRGNLFSEINVISERAKVETELQDVDLYKLLVVFQNALDKYHIEKNKPKHEIYRYPYTISEQKKFLINLIKSKSKISFINLIEKNPLKILVIFNFLAILELIQESKVKLSIGQGLNNFWITDLS
jgi:segregation and condensation protein A